MFAYSFDPKLYLSFSDEQMIYSTIDNCLYIEIVK